MSADLTQIAPQRRRGARKTTTLTVSAVMVVVASMLSLAPVGSAADPPDLDAAGLCDLLDQVGIGPDEGFRLSPDEANNSCVAESESTSDGPCPIPLRTEQPWNCEFVVLVKQSDTDAARRWVDDNRGELWETDTSLGDSAQRGCDPWICHILVQRDRFAVNASVVRQNFDDELDSGSLSRARQLAATIDDALVDLLRVDPPDDEPSADNGTDTVDSPPQSGPTVRIEDLMWGSEEASLGDIVIQARLGPYLECGDWVEDRPWDWDECEGVDDSIQRQSWLIADIVAAMPIPWSDEEKELVGIMTTAVFVENLQAKDGKPLFPSVVQGLPIVVKVLGGRVQYAPDGQTPTLAARRLLEMLMATDAGQWERRFGS